MNEISSELGSCGGAFLPVTGAGLLLNFRNAPLRVVLNYLHETIALPIEVNSDVDIDRPIDISSPQPVNKKEMLKLLRNALALKGYTAIDKNGMVSIIRSQDAKKHRIPLPHLVFSA